MGHDYDHIENVIFYPDSYVSDSSTATVSSFEKRVAVSAGSISDEWYTSARYDKSLRSQKSKLSVSTYEIFFDSSVKLSFDALLKQIFDHFIQKISNDIVKLKF